MAVLRTLPERGVENRPKVDEPSEENEPEYGRETKLNDRDQESALQELPEAWDEETAKRSDDVTGGTLTCHRHNFRRGEEARNPRNCAGREARP